MSDPMTHSDENDHSDDSRMGKAVVRGVILGVPIAIVALALVVWGITDLDLGDSLTTALLPGVLLGAFAGGFAGVALTMD
jgi:hypothetical protein